MSELSVVLSLVSCSALLLFLPLKIHVTCSVGLQQICLCLGGTKAKKRMNSRQDELFDGGGGKDFAEALKKERKKERRDRKKEREETG